MKNYAFFLVISLSASLRLLAAAPLAEVDGLFKQATKDGAKRYVPKTLSDVQKNYEKLTSILGRETELKTQIQKNAVTAVGFQLRRLLELTHAAKAFSDKTPEENALWVESRISRVARTYPLAIADHRDRSFDDQVALLRLEIVKLSHPQKSFVGDNKPELDEKLKRLRALFTPEEADISREGKRVTLRLKTLEFLKYPAGISPNGFSVLDKVQRGSKIFEEVKILVVAPTQSPDWAESIRNYLMSSGGISPSQVSIAGLGYLRPPPAEKAVIDVVLEVFE